MKIAVYTAIFGDKDDLKEPIDLSSNEGIDYYLITDNKELKSSSYKVVLKNAVYGDVTKNARFYKVNGIEEFHDYDYVIWHDGSLQMQHTLIQDLVGYAGQNFLATFQHPERKNFYEEAIACIKLNKDFSLKILWQSFIYFMKGVPSSASAQLYETCILVKNMRLYNHKFYNLWWKEILKRSRRDQLALPYVLYKLDLDLAIIPGCRNNNIYSKFSIHKKCFYDQKLNLMRFNFIKIKDFSVRLIRYFESKRYF